MKTILIVQAHVYAEEQLQELVNNPDLILQDELGKLSKIIQEKPDIFTLCWVGRFIPLKRGEDLICAATILKKKGYKFVGWNTKKNGKNNIFCVYKCKKSLKTRIFVPNLRK